MRPGWLTRTTTVLCVVAAAGIITSGLDLHGRAKVVGLAILTLAGVLGVVIDQRDKHRADQAEAARARLDVLVTLVPDGVPRAADPEAFIAAWVDDERAACLASIPSHGAAPARPAFRDLDQQDDTEDAAPGLTLGEMETLEARVEAGETLSPKDEARFNAAKKAIRVASFSAAIAASSQIDKITAAFTKADDRTEEQYRAEVDAHLRDGAEMLRAAVRWMEIEVKTARTQVQVLNGTDRNYMSVEVEIYIPGEVRGFDPEEVPELPDLMDRPRPFGSRTGISLGYGPGFSIPRYAQPTFRRGPSIDNGGSVRVRYPEFNLRPGETFLLDSIHLITDVPAGTVITGTWTATATNADGRATGEIAITVIESPLDVEATLTTWLAGDPDGNDD